MDDYFSSAKIFLLKYSNTMASALSHRYEKQFLCRIASDDIVHYVDQCPYLRTYLRAYLRNNAENYPSNSL